MSLTRVLGRASRTAVSQFYRSFFTLSPPPQHPHPLSLLSPRFLPLSDFSHQVSALHHGIRSVAASPRCGMSTSAPHEQEQGTPVENKGANGNRAEEAGAADAKDSEQTCETGSSSESQHMFQSTKGRRKATKRTAFSDSDSEVDVEDLSREELVKILFEKEEILQKKEKEFGEWKDKFLRSYAEMENVMERTRRDAENSKKFAVQSFAKSLLDVADNLSRASSVTRESFNKIVASEDTVGAVPLLKTLLEGVEMTDKQLSEVFRKSGIEKYDPTNEQFDPNRHNAVFQVPDNSKPPSTVAVVLKAGYTLHDRIIRPAEVGVTVAAENNEANS